MADITTIAELGTAGGTLVLAFATFASVRSANRAARVAERSLELNLRPLLVQSRPDHPPDPVAFGEGRTYQVGGGLAVVDRQGDDLIYMAIPLRNVGAGMGIVHGWHVERAWRRSPHEEPPDQDGFREQLRDLYVPPSDTGFWQGAIREPGDPYRESVEAALEGEEEGFTIFLLYADHEGRQLTISRFGLRPQDEVPDRWFCSVTRHWYLEGPDPRRGSQ